jgi:hypothetical protein
MNDEAFSGSFGGDDGFNDAATDFQSNMLRGQLLKCSDGHWLVGREGTPLEPNIRMVAIGAGMAWVRWHNNQPVQNLVRKPGEKMKERSELQPPKPNENDGAFQFGHEYELAQDGRVKDPWQNTRFLWLTDPRTAALYTFSTSSWAGRDAVAGLGDQIVRMRMARPGVSPVLEFESGPLQTKFGRKFKPVLKIVGWVGDSQSPLRVGETPLRGNATQQQQIGHAPAIISDMNDDEIPF